MTNLTQYTKQLVKTTLDLAACDIVRRSHMRQTMFSAMIIYFIKRIVAEMGHANYDVLAIRAVLETVKDAVEARLNDGKWVS